MAQTHNSEYGLSDFVKLDSSLNLWRTDSECRIAEVIYSPYRHPAAFLGADDFDMLPKDEAESAIAIKRLAFTTRQAVNKPMVCTWQGQERVFELLAIPNFDSSAIVSGLTCISVELTHQRRLVEALLTRTKGEGPPDDYASQWIGVLHGLRSVVAVTPNVQVGGVSVDAAIRGLRGPRGTARLTMIEWRVLQTLIASPDTMVSRERLLEEAWGPQYRDSFSLLHDVISRLRRRLTEAGSDTASIETHYRFGYRLSREIKTGPGLESSRADRPESGADASLFFKSPHPASSHNIRTAGGPS
jgi:DNA-binding winged helix-turn-helix (wHTH) protein